MAHTKAQSKNSSLHITLTHPGKNNGLYILVEEKKNDGWVDLWKFTVDASIKIKNVTDPTIQSILEKRAKEYMQTKEYRNEVKELKRFELAPLSYLCRDYVEYDDSHKEKRKHIDELLEQSTVSDINTPCLNGFTALHWAAMHRNNELIEKLMKLGANANLKNCYNRTPMSKQFRNVRF